VLNEFTEDERCEIIDLVDNSTEELGEILYRISVDENTVNRNNLASVKVNNIYGACDPNDNSRFIFTIDYESLIVIWLTTINSLTNDLYEFLDYSNLEVKKYLFTACLENVLIHEKRHLYQLQYLTIGINDVDINVDKEIKEYKITFTKDKIFELEIDANEYMLSKVDCTVLKDKKIKELYTKMEYWNILSFTTSRHDCDDSILSKCAENVTRYYDELLSHIKENY